MNIQQVAEVLDLLHRIRRENDENKNSRGERVALLSWGVYVALDEQINQLEKILDAMEAGV